MATLDRVPGNGLRILLKGAPDRLLSRCGEQRAANGGTEPLDLAFWETELDTLGGQALRVLAAPTRKLTEEKNNLALGDVDRERACLVVIGCTHRPRPQ